MLLILMLVSATIILIEGIPLVRKKQWKEFYTLISLLSIALALGIAKTIGMPTPIEILENLLYPLGKTVFK